LQLVLAPRALNPAAEFCVTYEKDLKNRNRANCMSGIATEFKMRSSGWDFFDSIDLPEHSSGALAGR
jgi:hypothetical protein